MYEVLLMEMKAPHFFQPRKIIQQNFQGFCFVCQNLRQGLCRQNRKVNNFNRCIIASISYNFNSFKDKYNGSGSAEDEINRF